VLVVHRHRGHQSVERQHARVVGDHQCRAGRRQIFNPADLNPEPRVEKHTQQRQKDCVVEVRVEPELVDGVVTHHPFTDEFGDRGDPLGACGRRVLGGRGARDGAAPLVDLAHDGGDLLGRSPPAGIREQRRMPA